MLRISDLANIELFFKKEVENIIKLENYKNNYFIQRRLKIGLLIFLLIPIFAQQKILSDLNTNKNEIDKNNIKW